MPMLTNCRLRAVQTAAGVKSETIFRASVGKTKTFYSFLIKKAWQDYRFIKNTLNTHFLYSFFLFTDLLIPT